MKITLTFENGNTETFFSCNNSIKLDKMQYLNAWRSGGIVKKVRKSKPNENITRESFSSINEHFTKFDGVQVR